MCDVCVNLCVCDVCPSTPVPWSTCGSQRTTLGFTAFVVYLVGDRVFLIVAATSAMLGGLGASRDFLISVPKVTIGAP